MAVKNELKITINKSRTRKKTKSLSDGQRQTTERYCYCIVLLRQRRRRRARDERRLRATVDCTRETVREIHGVSRRSAAAAAVCVQGTWCACVGASVGAARGNCERARANALARHRRHRCAGRKVRSTLLDTPSSANRTPTESPGRRVRVTGPQGRRATLRCRRGEYSARSTRRPLVFRSSVAKP